MDERREDGVDARGEEDGRGDDEEVVEDEVDEIIGVLLGGERARDVADDFEEEADGEGGEVPAAMAEELGRVDDEEDEEESGCEAGEGDGWGVAVDDYGRVPFACWRGKVWVGIAEGS